MAKAGRLKFLIEDSDDLAAASLHVQDSILRVGDMGYLPRQRRFALLLNRFRWEVAAGRFRPRPFERVRTGLHFDGVLRVRSSGLARDRQDDLLVLLALRFEPGPEAPGGIIRFDFAGGAALSLEVECIEGALADLSAPWSTAHRPQHDV